MTFTGVTTREESPQLPQRHRKLPYSPANLTVCRECGNVPPDINWRCRVCGPVLIAATLVKGGTDRWCDDCGRKIYEWPLRLTYKQGRTVFVSWVHPHVSDDEGQRACAPDVALVHAALGRGVDREKSNASTTDDGPATVRP